MKEEARVHVVRIGISKVQDYAIYDHEARNKIIKVLKKNIYVGGWGIVTKHYNVKGEAHSPKVSDSRDKNMSKKEESQAILRNGPIVTYVYMFYKNYFP